MTRHSKLIGFLYLMPALLFVLAFTAYPFIQMIWVSFNNWTLITPPKFVGTANFERAFADEQFWVSLGFTLKYTLIITPILMIGGAYLCFEATEKIIEAVMKTASHEETTPPVEELAQSSAEIEAQKVAGAIRTDFILSGEIMAIALATVADFRACSVSVGDAGGDF